MIEGWSENTGDTRGRFNIESIPKQEKTYFSNITWVQISWWNTWFILWFHNIMFAHFSQRDSFSSMTWWRHQMVTFSALLALCARNSPSPLNSQHKGQWRGALMFSLICAWINAWANNREAGDLRRHRAHYDVIVIIWFWFSWSPV